MPPDSPHFGYGHGCDQCKLALTLHTGCPQLGTGRVVEEATPVAKKSGAEAIRVFRVEESAVLTNQN